MINIEGIECDVEIKLQEEGMVYEEHYIFGPVGNKEDDLVSIPIAFLNKGLDMFDYDNVKEITLKIRKE